MQSPSPFLVFALGHVCAALGPWSDFGQRSKAGLRGACMQVPVTGGLVGRGMRAVRGQRTAAAHAAEQALVGGAGAGPAAPHLLWTHGHCGSQVGKDKGLPGTVGMLRMPDLVHICKPGTINDRQG